MPTLATNAAPINFDHEQSSPRFHDYTLSTDINIITDGGGQCRGIKNLATYNIVLILLPSAPFNPSSPNETCTLLPGQFEPIKARYVYATGSTVGATFRIYW